MFAKFANLLRRLDLYLVGVSVLLVFVGLLMIYSTSFSGLSHSSLLVRQSILLVAGICLLFLFSALDYRYFRKISLVIYAAAVLMLIGVLFFGIRIKGGLRWFNLGMFQLQPAEFAKLALIIYLSAFFHKKLPEIGRFRNVLLGAFFMALPVTLTLLQPDLGSAAVLFAIWVGLMLAARVKKRHLLWLFVIFLAISAVAGAYFLKDYQKDRIVSFLSPEADPQGSGYNALQSIIAVGSGGIFGRGLARGVVSQLRFLPERQTDFIFASLAEELGFVGATFLLILLALWFYRIIRIINLPAENFGMFLAVGIFYYLFVQTSINIGMNVGLLPITGVPLPLISYGGSSLITTLVSIGVLQSVVVRSQGGTF